MLIPARFNGPPGSGNGGWCAGTFAAAAGARVGGPGYQVTLRVPPPLETPLSWSDGVVRAPDGTLVAEVLPVARDPNDDGPNDDGPNDDGPNGDGPNGDGPDDGVGPVVPAAAYLDAVGAAAAYPGFVDHPFPGCYVCGPDRAEGDGLRIFPGRLADGRTAAPWTVPPDVTAATMWAALDCPGGWAVLGAGRPYLLGRIAAAVAVLPEPGAACVVVGACSAARGRKAQVRSTVYGPRGRPLATARATWIAIG
jgi:hypothetical protein